MRLLFGLIICVFSLSSFADNTAGKLLEGGFIGSVGALGALLGGKTILDNTTQPQRPINPGGHATSISSSPNQITVNVNLNHKSIAAAAKAVTAIFEPASEEPTSQVLEKSNSPKLRKNLNEERKSLGLPPDPENCDGHHIVPGGEGRSWAKEFTDPSRKILESCNIDIDSAENGVYLPNNSNEQSECEGTYHKTLHTKNYYSQVLKRLNNVKSEGCEEVKNELAAIKEDLISGRNFK